MQLADIPPLYAGFNAPLADLDCGQKCAPYNSGIPFCCDIHHAVPTAYPAEWEHLHANTGLWQVWESDNESHRDQLQTEAGNLILLECLMLTYDRQPDLSAVAQGSSNKPDRASNLNPAQPPALSKVEVKDAERYCHRDHRTLVCRAFPFFPYFDSCGKFLGLSVYSEYADRCWVISNLQIVRHEYKVQFIETYEKLFAHLPEERKGFQYHSAEMRRTFQSRRQTIPLLHRDGYTYKISPATEKLHRVAPESFPKYGPYKIADALLFPDEDFVHR